MWYVVQTTTGKEEELVDVIYRQISKEKYGACFTLKRQLLKRLGGEWIIVVSILFPSYVFLETDHAEGLFYQLKKIPEYTKLLGDNEGSFIPLENEEEKLIKNLCLDSAYMVKLSKVILDRTGAIERIDGPLGFYKEKIININLRKRNALIRLMIAGKNTDILLGTILEQDRIKRI